MNEEQIKQVQQIAYDSYNRGALDVVNSLQESVETLDSEATYTKDDIIDLIEMMRNLVEEKCKGMRESEEQGNKKDTPEIIV